jgi:hypothetical protein
MSEQKEPQKDSLLGSSQEPPRQEETTAAATPSAQEGQPTAEGPSAGSSKKTKNEPYWWYLFSNKKVWCVVIGTFFLLYFTGIVPAGSMPLLRNFTRMMGYSEEEAKGMSFLQALLAWSDHNKRAQDEQAREQENRRKMQQLAENNAVQSGKMLPSSLINWGEVNSSLREQGKQADSVSGVDAEGRSGMGVAPVALAGAGEGGNIRTDANNVANLEDVYFGAVAGGVERNKNDGYDSFKMLAKVANPYQISSSGNDWIGQSATNAFWAESGVADLLQQVAETKGGGFVMNSNIREISDQRPRQDMYYAWLTARAGARTKDVWLMKTLAAAGFLGADLDRQMLTVSAVGNGLSFDEDAVLNDLENVEKRLEFEKECNETLAADGDQLTNNVRNMQMNISSLNEQFPQTCADDGAAFLGALNTISAQCNQINDSYEKLNKGCQIQYVRGSCNVEGLREQLQAFREACQAENDRCQSMTEEEKSACYAAAAGKSREEVGVDSAGARFGSEQMTSIIKGETAVSTDENGQVTGTPFFSTTNWQATFEATMSAVGNQKENSQKE